MKKCLLLMCLIISGCSAFSQLNKGQWLAGGNTSFSYNKTSPSFGNYTPTSVTTLELSPDAGYFFVDKVVAGLRVDFSKTWFRPDSSSILNSERLINLSPFIRFYVLPKASKVNLFAEASFLYGRTRTNFAPSNNGTGSNSFTYKTDGYSVAAGTVIFLHPRLGLEFKVTYKNTDTKGYSPEYNTINIMGGVGFQIHLGK